MARPLEVLIAIVFRIFHFGYQFLLSIVIGKRQRCVSPVINSILLESATRLANKIRTNQVSSESVVKAFINRIQTVNPIINAMVEDRFLSAIDEARDVDKFLASTSLTVEEIKRQKPFLGVPVTTKNGIGIKGLLIDSGVKYRIGRRSKEDSDVIKKMRAAGAIPLCSTNVPELCMWLDSANNIHGRTFNPYDLNRVPGGSSGGEAALLASAGSVIGIGNDIAGSIRYPCFCCGIFGHKTTPTILSQEGQFPSTHQNELKYYVSTGPMCRYAEDMLPMLKVLAGDNGKKLKLHQKVDIKTIKVYYTDDYIKSPYATPMYPEMQGAVLRVVNKLRKTHDVSIKCIGIPAFNNAMGIWYSKIATAKCPSFDEMLTDGRYDINPFWELFKWFFRVSDHTLHMIFFLITLKINPALSPLNKEKNLKILDEVKEKLLLLLGDDGVLIYPPQPEPAIFHYEQVAKLANWGYTAIFSVMGFPVTQCPVGFNENGLPVGVQVVASPFMDRLTLAVAKEIESLFGGWSEPR